MARPRLEELEGRLVPSVVAPTSTNWSGYAVTAKSGSVTAVSGSWVVPAVSAGSRRPRGSAGWGRLVADPGRHRPARHSAGRAGARDDSRTDESRER
ncbi:MAG TPA: hypothetical protein VFW33_10960 [Gemmataceae bacterium]|nr:hypothetical protein [Gemmataceae bacterium]